MTKKLFLFHTLVIALFTSITASAQTAPPHVVFSKKIGGTKDDHPGKTIQLPNKGYLICGWTFSNDGDVTGFHGTSGTDAWLVKTDSLGNVIWGRAIGGTGEDNVFSAVVLNDSTYIVGGKTSSTNGDFATLTGPSSKGYIAWINAYTGAIRKIKVYTGNLSGELHTICLLDSGKMAVFGQKVYTSPIKTLWVTKMDTAGNIIWDKCYGRGTCCATGDVPGSMIARKGGGFMITAQTNSVDGDVTGFHGLQDVWLASLNDTGKIVWAKCYGGSGGAGPIGIHQTSDSGYICAAMSNVNDSDVVGSKGGEDYWVFKVNDTGKIKWSRAIGGTGDEFMAGSDVTCDDGVVVSGYSMSPIGGDITSTHGIADLFTVRLDSAGNIKWAHNYGTSIGEFEGTVLVTRDNGYMLLGLLSGTDGDAAGTPVHGFGDIWMAKLSDDTLGNYCPTHDTVVVIHPAAVTATAATMPAVAIYPNPAHTSLNIQLTGSNEPAIVSLYDITGRLQLTAQYAPNAPAIALPVAQLPDGLYTVVITTGGSRITKKVSILH